MPVTCQSVAFWLHSFASFEVRSSCSCHFFDGWILRSEPVGGSVGRQTLVRRPRLVSVVVRTLVLTAHRTCRRTYVRGAVAKYLHIQTAMVDLTFFPLIFQKIEDLCRHLRRIRQQFEIQQRAQTTILLLLSECGKSSSSAWSRTI